MPFSGSGYHAYICIEKIRDGDGKNVILAALGSEPLLKHVAVVDEDIDIFNEKEVLWALSTRFQADQGLCLIPGARTSPLDPSSYGLSGAYKGEGLVTKVGFDATRPLGIPFPERTGVPREVMDRILLEEYIEKNQT
jgi:2,5-furandicarboxylate decarboxylase 1